MVNFVEWNLIEVNKQVVEFFISRMFSRMRYICVAAFWCNIVGSNAYPALLQFHCFWASFTDIVVSAVNVQQSQTCNSRPLKFVEMMIQKKESIHDNHFSHLNWATATAKNQSYTSRYYLRWNTVVEKYLHPRDLNSERIDLFIFHYHFIRARHWKYS